MDYKILGVKDMTTSVYGTFLTANGDNVYLYWAREPIWRINFDTKEEIKIGKVGKAPGEYILPSYLVEHKGLIYIGDLSTGRLQAFDFNGEFVKHIVNGLPPGKFVFCNDTVIVARNATLMENYFETFDIKNKKYLAHFGKSVEYPIAKYRIKLPDEGKAIPYPIDWDVRDTILVGYDYYHDRFRVYNVYTGKMIKTFGRKHKGWSIPRIYHFPGDQYHQKSLMVSSTPCESVVLTGKYIYVCFGKIWKYNWRLKGIPPKKYKKIKTNKFYFVDIYRRDDFGYIGTIYPLDKFIYKNGKSLSLWGGMRCDGDSILSFYLRHDKFLRKVSVSIHIPQKFR